MTSAPVPLRSVVLDRIAAARLLPVAVVEDTAHAHPLGDALVAGGLQLVEITFRTSAAPDVLNAMAGRNDLLVGVGTVLTAEQARRAVDAGARFVVSPGFSDAVVSTCLDQGVPVIPGVSTATELMAARDAGLRVVKFFPAAAAGGPPTIKALSSAFSDVFFIPTGGIGADNLADYLSVASVLAVGGSWMVEPALLGAGHWDEVRDRSAEAVARVSNLESAHPHPSNRARS